MTEGLIRGSEVEPHPDLVELEGWYHPYHCLKFESEENTQADLREYLRGEFGEEWYQKNIAIAESEVA